MNTEQTCQVHNWSHSERKCPHCAMEYRLDALEARQAAVDLAIETHRSRWRTSIEWIDPTSPDVTGGERPAQPDTVTISRETAETMLAALKEYQLFGTHKALAELEKAVGR